MFNNEQTKDLIIDLIKYKLNTSNLDDLQNKEIKNKEFLIIKFKNKLFDKIGFNGILKECENTFPLKNKIINKIAFAYEKPLKNKNTFGIFSLTKLSDEKWKKNIK